MAVSGHDGSLTFILRRYIVIGIAAMGTEYTYSVHHMEWDIWLGFVRQISPLITHDKVVRDNRVTTCRPCRWVFVCTFS